MRRADVSKDTLDLYFNDESGREHYLHVSNDQKGHALVIEKLGTNRTYVMESTGPYYLWFAFSIHHCGAIVRVENPITIKRFIQMNLERNKSDKKDARWLYRYGVEREGMPWQPPCKESLKCTQIMALIDLYIRQTTQLSNQLHSLQ
jgi:transposase